MDLPIQPYLMRKPLCWLNLLRKRYFHSNILNLGVIIWGLDDRGQNPL
jgi:hypothetical protein